jgi:hypothetical protein
VEIATRLTVEACNMSSIASRFTRRSRPCNSGAEDDQIACAGAHTCRTSGAAVHRSPPPKASSRERYTQKKLRHLQQIRVSRTGRKVQPEPCTVEVRCRPLDNSNWHEPFVRCQNSNKETYTGFLNRISVQFLKKEWGYGKLSSFNAHINGLVGFCSPYHFCVVAFE